MFLMKQKKLEDVNSMKKILIALAVVLLAVPAFAQTPTAAGNFVVSLPLIEYVSRSGDLYENADGDGDTRLSIGALGYQLGIEWFVIDSLAIGGQIGYSTYKWGDYEDTTLTIAPAVTYYINMDGLIPYVGIGYEYISADDDVTETVNSNLFVKAGAAFMLGRNLAAFGELRYSMDNTEWTTGGTSIDDDGTALTIALGIKAFF
jgi:outer membrane protein W